MENIDPRALAIVQKQIRPTADRLIRLYFDIKEFKQQAQGQIWGTAFPVANDDTIPDGTTQPCTNYRALAVLSVVDQVLAVFEASADQNLNLLLSTRAL